uniref:Auto-transporter adhesin head GIN domain-containing protein n=1 Tax=Chromera velia CCMP2878 TaxID=1169474 RepID=A0A0G4HEL4_9ALVE|eukprot:Cvel_26802.t1-p1 / transcript=Cvel_26802.t1 / gene=Cvel_26802 / organism=Chromera_velia_CCMP2878 / gene_product=hypothetical protein / transcript_product=hypothetical protein / location=Cvel_scaffold3246:14277-18082(+) / protein_length=857 / sequence_SO=supercontig / SO=protein_coding / is_pseudo=false
MRTARVVVSFFCVLLCLLPWAATGVRGGDSMRGSAQIKEDLDDVEKKEQPSTGKEKEERPKQIARHVHIPRHALEAVRISDEAYLDATVFQGTKHVNDCAESLSIYPVTEWSSEKCEFFAVDGDLSVCGDVSVEGLLSAATSLEVKPSEWLPSECIIEIMEERYINGHLRVKGSGLIVNGNLVVGRELNVRGDVAVDMSALVRVGVEYIRLAAQGCQDENLGRTSVTGQVGLDNAGRFVSYGRVEASMFMVDDFSQLLSSCGSVNATRSSGLGILVTDGSLFSLGGSGRSFAKNVRVEKAATAEFFGGLHTEFGVEGLDASSIRVGGSVLCKHLTMDDTSEAALGGNLTATGPVEVDEASSLTVNGQFQSAALRVGDKSLMRVGRWVLSRDILLVEGHSTLEVWNGDLNVGGRVEVLRTSSIAVTQGRLYARGAIRVQTSMLLVQMSVLSSDRLQATVAADIKFWGSAFFGLDAAALPRARLDIPEDDRDSNVALASEKEMKEQEGVGAYAWLGASEAGFAETAEDGEREDDLLRRLQIDIRKQVEPEKEEKGGGGEEAGAIDPEMILAFHSKEAAARSKLRSSKGTQPDEEVVLQMDQKITKEQLDQSSFAALAGLHDDADTLLTLTTEEAMRLYFGETKEDKDDGKWADVGATSQSFALDSSEEDYTEGGGNSSSSFIHQLLTHRGVLIDMSSVMVVGGNLTARDLLAVDDGSSLSVLGSCGVFKGRIVVDGRSRLNVTGILEVLGQHEAAVSVLQKSELVVGGDTKSSYLEAASKATVIILGGLITSASVTLFGRSAVFVERILLVRGGLLAVKEGSRLIAAACGVERGDVFVDDGAVLEATKGSVRLWGGPRS